MKIIFSLALLALITACGNSNHMQFPSTGSGPNGSILNHSTNCQVNGAPSTSVPSSTQTNPSQPTTLALTYLGSVQSIIKRDCAACHGAGSALGDWLDYNSIYAKRAMVLQHVTVDRSMPKPPFNATITEQERTMIGQWVNAGAPLGVAPPTQPSTPSTPDAPLPTNCDTTTPPTPPVNTDPATATLTLDKNFIQAVIASDVALVTSDLQQGAHPNIVDSVTGLTPLMLAIEHTSLPIIKLLVAKNADTHVTLMNGTSVLSVASKITDPKVKNSISNLIYADIDQNGNLYFLTYKKNMRDLFQLRCSECHNHGGFPQADWSNYMITYAQKDNIYDRVVVKQDMPYWMYNDMTSHERVLVGKWVLSGAGE